MTVLLPYAGLSMLALAIAARFLLPPFIARGYPPPFGLAFRDAACARGQFAASMTSGGQCR
nr:hypothetical protein [uncultured Shinella sp.]